MMKWQNNMTNVENNDIAIASEIWNLMSIGKKQGINKA